MDQVDTIAAIATPLGIGGIGVVRVSGPAALSIAQRVFVRPSGETMYVSEVTSGVPWLCGEWHGRAGG